MAKDRMRSVDATVHKELSAILTRDIFPLFSNCIITLTGVKTSPDLHQARCFISAMGDSASKYKVMRTLEQKRGEINKTLGRRLRIKFTPQISWRFDSTPEDADNISRLIDSLDIPAESDEDNDESED